MPKSRLRFGLSYSPLIVAIALTLASPSRALAVPGETIAQLKAASQRNVMLLWFVQSRDELSGLPMLKLDAADHGAATALPCSRRGYGFTVLSALYRGSDVAADWRRAKLVARVTDPTNKATTAYLLGRVFGFSVTGGRGLTIYTQRRFRVDLALALKLAKKCAADPAFCASGE